MLSKSTLLIVLIFSYSFIFAADTGNNNAVKWKSAPVVEKKDGKLVLKFTLEASSDVEISVLNQKDEVVRHLAAGVLGGLKAPPAPLKEGLSQELIWDGKDDFGNTVSVGEFKYRVRVGSQFKFGRFIGEDPYTFGKVDGLSVDEEGNLYISASGGTHNQSARTLRVYNGQGKYLRELMPFSSELKPNSMSGVANWDEEAKTWRPISKSCLVPEIYNAPNISLLSASIKNGIYFADSQDVYALNSDGCLKSTNFGLKQKPWPIFDSTSSEKNHYGHPWHYQVGAVCYSASLDGKWLYLTGPVSAPDKRKTEDPRFPVGGVYRMRMDGKDEMKLFVSVPATFDGPWAKEGGKNYSGSGPIHFVGCDKDNNVYVPDRQANRVVIFSEDGKQIGEFPVKNPHQVVINPKTNEIYVLRMFTNGWGTHAIAIEKFEQFKTSAKSMAVFDKIDPKTSPRIACTIGKEKTIIWLAGAPSGMIAIEDSGNNLVPTETLFKRKPESQIDWNRLSVDYTRDEVYVADGGNMIWRYDGKTGAGGILKDKKNQPFAAVDLSVGYDGLLYIRTGTSFSGPLERYTLQLEPAPYQSGTHIISPSIYSRYGIGNCEKGLGVGPKGEVYINFMYDWTLYAIGGFGGDGKALNGKYLEGVFPAKKPENLKGYPPEMKSAVVGPVTSAGGGVRVDKEGNIYLGLDVKPEGNKVPAYMSKDEVGKRWSCSVVKFAPNGGAILGITDSASKMPEAPKISLENKLMAENALQIYPGLGPVSGAGPGGNSSCCVCRVPRFDVDRFGRVIMPSAYRANVLYYDNSGNVIAEIGSYGNFDSQLETGKSPSESTLVNTSLIPLTWPSGAGVSENHIYINDTYARRVVRADKAFVMESIVNIK